jgi:serine/threonine-protein kinase
VLPRTAAIVVLHPAVVDDRDLQCAILEDIRRRFKVRSGNVVQTLGIRRDEFVYLVTEWVDGPNARRLRTYVELFKDSSIPSPETLWWPRIAIKIITDCIRGLDAIHSSRDDDGAPLALLHSNIAPENVFVDRDGIAKLSGSLHASLRRRLMQLEGKKIGSEEPANPDQLTDIQAIGFTLWELLTDRGEQPAYSQAKSDDPEAPSPLLPGQPRVLAELLLKATHRDPAQRFQSASEFEVALERVARKHHLVATAGDVARFVRRYKEWEMESKTMVRAPSSNPPPPCREVEPEPEPNPGLELTIIDTRLAPPLPRVAVQPPPLPPRQRTSSRPARPHPPQAPRRTVEIASCDVEPAQPQLPVPDPAQPQIQPITLRKVRQLPQRSTSLVLVTWFLAGTALLGVSSSAVALYQRHAQGGSEASPASPAALHETQSTAPVEIAPDVAPAPATQPAVPAIRSEPWAGSAGAAQPTTAVDVVRQRASLANSSAPSGAPNAGMKTKRASGNSPRLSEISDPWSR